MHANVNFPPDFGTRLSISIDTEEEFAWNQALTRDGHTTQSVPALAEGQGYFEAAGVVPIYYVDAPVAADERAAAILGGAQAAGKAHIGAHLHPWVTPPFVEDVNRRNSYAGNLPEEVERAKLRHLTDLIEQRLGVRPFAYRAGRYGIGPNSLRILAEEGYRVDSSVRSLFDYRDDGGPDFRWADYHCGWVGPAGKLLELPLTTVFTGHAGRFGRQVFAQIESLTTLRALLARSGMIERIPLTPEGCPADKACEGIDAALDCGIRLLSISFHSPSLQPGHTPYVRTPTDLVSFYGWFDIVLNHAAKRGVSPANLDQILSAAETARGIDTCASPGSGAIAAA
jgi:hypothetical protein